MHEAAGGGYPGETVDALWTLVWAGAVTNDSLPRACARSRGRPKAPRPRGAARRRAHRPLVRSAAGGWRHRPPKAAGRSLRRVAAPACRRRSRPRRSRSSCCPLRRAHPRGRLGRRDRRWLQRGLRRSQSARGCRAHPARLLRERRRRDAVRAARRARPAAVAQRSARRAGGRRARGHRSRDNPDGPISRSGPRERAQTAAEPKRAARRAREGWADALGRLARRDRQRRARGVHQPRRTTTARVYPRGRAGAIDDGRALATALARLARSSCHEINGLPAAEHPLAAYLVEAGFSPRRWASRFGRPGSARGVGLA